MDLNVPGEAATSRAIDKLDQLLSTKVKLPAGVKRSEIEAFKRELQTLRRSFSDDEHLSKAEEQVKKVWLEQLKEVSELIEDVADEYVLRASQDKKSTPFLRRASRLIGLLSVRRDGSNDLQNIKALLREVTERGSRHAFISKTRTKDWISTRLVRVSYQIEDDTVGLKLPFGELVQRLTGRELRRSVVSLVGLGGVGKTTLAQKVFAAAEVRRRFHCFAWISVTPSYELGKILKTLAQLIGLNGPDTMDSTATSGLIDVFQRFLSSKVRYFFVFDDVWDDDFWRRIEPALPDESNGSRVIVTTRSHTVARRCSGTSFDHVQEVEAFSIEDSLILFRSRVFGSSRSPDVDLDRISYEIVRMCEGLPLAIVALAGMLSRKTKSVWEWGKVLHYLKSDENEEVGKVHKVLRLCFHNLPFNLKLCFLYFGILPEDSVIPNEKLVKLWIAEDFIKDKSGQTLEQVAEEYLDELVSRNMVQECKWFYGIEKFFQVHDLMRELARDMGEKFSFCRFRDDQNSNVGQRTRRLSISRRVEENFLETIEPRPVRCVFLSNIDALSNSFVVHLFTKFELLTLLDFENVSLEYLPEEVGNLLLLKYLSLRSTKVKRLPKSVGKLENLQTLDLRNTPLLELPVEINKLRKLRHLLATRYDNDINLDITQGVIVKEGIGSLEELQTLMTVDANLSGFGLIEELKKLKKLTRMGISGLTAELSSALCVSVEKMGNLESLSIASMEDEILNLQSISSPPPLLSRLVLKGLLHTFPSWISALSNLSMLCLSLSKLRENPLQKIHSLPNLMSLWLYGAYQGEHFRFQEGGFLGLKLLVLREMRRLKVVEIAEGALPLLEELRIGPSPNLAEVPSGVRHLKNLKAISFYDMPNEFVDNILPDGGSHYEKIEHVPSVIFWYRSQGRDYISYGIGEPGLQDRLQGVVQDMSNVIRHDHRLSFSYSDDGFDFVSRCSSSSNKCISEYDFDI